MDPLSRLVGLARPEGSIDVRCLLAGRSLKSGAWHEW